MRELNVILLEMHEVQQLICYRSKDSQTNCGPSAEDLFEYGQQRELRRGGCGNLSKPRAQQNCYTHTHSHTFTHAHTQLPINHWILFLKLPVHVNNTISQTNGNGTLLHAVVSYIVPIDIIALCIVFNIC